MAVGAVAGGPPTHVKGPPPTRNSIQRPQLGDPLGCGVSLTTLTFATVLAMVKPGAASGAGRSQEPNGDESRRGSQSVSAHPINRT
jgi:hypothetical protein